ncbi:MAG: nuclear transport factor 2 family protein [Betaproteobacteria bacterium]|nr:nuclear transport factor 2 family protein [Betaproteobacteria bacterium]
MPRPNPAHHASPEDASRAFYESFEQGDIAAMMAVWSDDDEIFCIHPGGPRNVGQAAVRGAWEEIFGGPARLRFQLEQQLFFVGASMAVQSVFEYLQVDDEPKLRGPAIATNIYTRTAGGWRILAHHAAVAPTVAPATAPPRSGTLH